MTVAEETRAAVRERPFLYDALRAGVVNYAAAAATLDIDADRDAVATALRRFANELDERAGSDADAPADAGARVRMERGVGAVDPVDAAGDDETAEPVLAVGSSAYAAGAGDATAVVAAGDVDPRALERVLGRLRVAGVAVDAAGVTPTGLAVVVGGRAGADALRAVEAALDG
ncbi:DUF7523 family protein [Halobaculum magnesiiphilum]|uniref:Uncharacterized protein n=1 Tax=Halobaculum magnesiiphilum TaxID=1017351 RepID=A0A8T8WFP7_9EURY|nr:hypothetical protein [Halobaculum magnesiiphilum]QZP38675.1 hypothetical protein K6T50_05925 [Halobaculum magnesiiphilum]